MVRISKGPTLLHCQESPENWFEDFGEGALVNGRCHIELDPLFLETVTIDEQNPMKVFVELSGRCHDTYVERGTTGFDVVGQDDGTSAAGFCYRVVSKRKGYEAKRLDYCKAAETDAYLYPELREREMGGVGSRQSPVDRPAAHAAGGSKHWISTEVVPSAPTAESRESTAASAE